MRSGPLCFVIATTFKRFIWSDLVWVSGDTQQDCTMGIPNHCHAGAAALVDALESADLVFLGRTRKTAGQAATLIVETSLRGTQDGAQLVFLGSPGGPERSGGRRSR